MSFELSQELPENMQDILRSAVNVVNDDFDMGSFMQAFSKNTTRSNKPKNFTMLPTKVPVDRTESSFHQDNLRSCPIMHDPIFNFDEGSLGPKDPYFQNIQKHDHGQNDKLKNLMNENNIRKAITDMVNQNGGNLDLPTLKVQVTGNPNYEIEESDILNLFSRYGKVVSISLAKHRTAYIVFSEIISALYAQKSLNNQYVRQFDIKLYVSWSNGEEDLRVEPEQHRQQLINQNSKGVYQNSYLQNLPLSTSKSLPNLDSIPTFSYNPVKFTCKYEIQIDNDKDFKIARKIIGPKGCNMKKIIELCKIQVNRRDLNMQSDFLKLRLRGKGSGFKEGSEQKESDDPLHLCVSSKYQEVYNIACKYVEDLIGSLYKEYEAFCQMADRPLSEPVQIKKIEISNGIEKKFSEEYKSFNHNLTRKSSIEYNMMQNMKSLNVSGNSNSPHESPNNSLTALSDKDNTNSPNSRNNTSHPDTTRSP